MAEQKVFSSSSIEDNRKFLDYFDFKDTGCYYTYNNGELEFYEDNIKLLDKQAGIFCFCLDDCIVHIGANSNVLGILSSSYKTGGTETTKENGKKKQGTETFNRVNAYLKELKKAVSIRVKIYYKNADKDKEKRRKQKKLILHEFQNVFHDKPLWNKRRENYNTNNIILENLVNNTREISYEDKIKMQIEDILDEKKSNYFINSSTSRSNEVRKMALLHANNKCFLEDSEHCEQAYFKRKNIIIEGNDNYLEVHHLIPLWLVNSQNDETKQQLLHNSDLDIEANTVCLCSNCHNKLHYGTKSEVERLLKNLYDRKKNELEKEHLFITFDDLRKTYIED